MSRINPINVDQAAGKAKELLDTVQAKLGIKPNMMKTMAQSPAVLEAYLGLNTTLASTFTGKLREQIALVTAEENNCGYCRAAHTALGKLAGLTDEESLAARAGTSEDLKTRAALEFARAVLRNKGSVTDVDLGSVRAAGFSDANIAEIVAHVALNVFTNYFNLVAETEIDFPRVEPIATAKAV